MKTVGPEGTMDLYDSIADNYSRIFPLDAERIGFIQSFLNHGDIILDLGCATGDLCVELAQAGYNVWGIDANARMIEIACRKAGKTAEFKVMNMLDIDRHFKNIKFSLITCLGNTLPHLDSLSEITCLFKQVYSRLSSNGRFIFQILNYNKILKEKKCGFPVIKGPDFVFSRKYEFLNGKIRFIISMKIKRKKLTDSTLLFPLTKEPAVSSLHEAGFKKTHCFSDYSLKPSDEKEAATLYVAEK
ncbi:MAG: class I SAM-dependent methyltransferase [Spirochaetales bacterium]|nr:class I SAM-dependent methyltransferase [Spirochaetales bacterium]